MKQDDLILNLLERVDVLVKSLPKLERVMESTMTTLGTKNLSMLQTERLMTYYKEMFSFYNTTLTTLSKVLVSVSPTATFEERELVKTFRGLDWKEKQKLFRLLEAVKDE